MKMIKQTLGLNVEDSKYYIKLIIEAVLIGLFSGLVVSLYRFGLDNSENILFSTLKYICMVCHTCTYGIHHCTLNEMGSR